MNRLGLNRKNCMSAREAAGFVLMNDFQLLLLVWTNFVGVKLQEFVLQSSFYYDDCRWFIIQHLNPLHLTCCGPGSHLVDVSPSV